MAESHPKCQLAHSHKVSLPLTVNTVSLMAYHSKWGPNFCWEFVSVSHGVCTFRSSSVSHWQLFKLMACQRERQLETCDQFYSLWVSLALSHHLSVISALFNCSFILDTFADIWPTIQVFHCHCWWSRSLTSSPSPWLGPWLHTRH